MAKKDSRAAGAAAAGAGATEGRAAGGSSGDPLLPTVAEPGTFEWCEEVVECMLSAWRGRETSEQGFLAAARAAVNYRIWEMLSPPPPQEPYTSLENLIRRTADEGQAENMQLVIKFGGVLDEAGREAGGTRQGQTSGPAHAPPWEAAVPAAGIAGRGNVAETNPEAGTDPEVALGEALLAQFAAQLGVSLEKEGGAPHRPVGIPAGIASGGSGGGPGSGGGTDARPRMSAAERKRERLERSHPELVDAVEAGEMTLKQAYVEAGIEKQVQTIDKLQKLWRSASEEERERFLSWLDEQISQERKRTYQEEVYGDDA